METTKTADAGSKNWLKERAAICKFLIIAALFLGQTFGPFFTQDNANFETPMLIIIYNNQLLLIDVRKPTLLQLVLSKKPISYIRNVHRKTYVKR